MARAVGIDLGTTFSEIAVMEGGEPKIIPSAEGGNLFPSVVAIFIPRTISRGAPYVRRSGPFEFVATIPPNVARALPGGSSGSHRPSRPTKC